MKSEIFNLIILDESGSMDCVTAQTISGCNETINTIRAAQEKFADTQEHFVSIYAFQSGGPMPSRYIIKNMPIAQVKNITPEQYDPYGCTPLYDAVGSTLTDLKAMTSDSKFAIGSVTIITDGLENSSGHYTRAKVARMIDALKEQGWSFNFIGANIDVEATAQSLNIDNAMEFEQSIEGTERMFRRESSSRLGWLRRVSSCLEKMDMEAPTNNEMRSLKEDLREAASDYFDEDRGSDINK